jgi:hypothetical protein
MPGPVSDSYDPEFGTDANAHDVKTALQEVVATIGSLLGSEFKNIVSVAHGDEGRPIDVTMNERTLRLIRFGINRALETL